MPNSASRRRRIAGIAIDFLFALTTMMVAIMLLSENNWDDGRSFSKAIPAVVMGIMFALLIGRDAISGISLGRLLSGTAVRDANNAEQIPSLGRLIIRGIFLPLWPVELLLLLIQKRRIADMATQTIVVRHVVSGWSGMRRLGLAVAVVAALFVLLRVAGYIAIGHSSAYATARMVVSFDNLSLGDISVSHFSSGIIEIRNGQGFAVIPLRIQTTTETRTMTVSLRKEQGRPWGAVNVVDGVKNVGLHISMSEDSKTRYYDDMPISAFGNFPLLSGKTLVVSNVNNLVTYKLRSASATTLLASSEHASVFQRWSLYWESTSSTLWFDSSDIGTSVWTPETDDNYKCRDVDGATTDLIAAMPEKMWLSLSSVLRDQWKQTRNSATGGH